MCEQLRTEHVRETAVLNKLVEEFFDIDFKLEVIDYSVELSAGIDFRSPELFKWFGLEFAVIFKMAGKLSGAVAVTAKLTSR